MPVTDTMPTAARAVAAILMAVVAWFASDMIRPLMPEGTDFGIFNFVNAGLGLIAGWRVTGKRLGFGWSNGVSAGLTGMAALVIIGVLLQSLYKMLEMALDRRYDGLMEGLTNIFEIGAEYTMVLAHGPVIALLVGGGIAIGLIGEWISHRWS